VTADAHEERIQAETRVCQSLSSETLAKVRSASQPGKKK